MKVDGVYFVSADDIDAKVRPFREYLASLKRFPSNMNTVLLYRFLRICDFDATKAGELLEKNMRYRKRYPQLFANRDIFSPETQTVISIMQFTQIQAFTRDNLHVTIIRLVDNDASKFNIVEVFRWLLITFDAGLANDRNGFPAGEIAVTDCKGYTLWHLLKAIAHLNLVMASLKFAQEAVPAYIVQNHYINCSPYFVRFLDIVKPIVRKEHLENMHVHTDKYDTLYKFVPRDLLPVEYGGTNGSMDDMNKRDVDYYSSQNDFVKDESMWKLSNQ